MKSIPHRQVDPMKRSFISLSLAVAVLAACLAWRTPALAVQASQAPESAPLQVGQPFPELTFKGKLTPETAKEFGLKANANEFTMSQIKAPVVILVVYSMYCPFCQKEAPQLNQLHELIKQRKLSDKLKLIGMGAGNSTFEVNVFREKYAVTFPLVSDEKFQAYKAVGTVGTPYYYVLKRKGQGYVVLDGLLGCVESVDGFLDSVVAKTGLDKE